LRILTSEKQTFTTVGYGDISPVTNLGRVLVIVMILIAAMMIPIQISKLLEIMSLTSSKY
jgi:hypothetical protein